MDLIGIDDFSQWATGCGIGPDPESPRSARLIFPAAPDCWRSWDVPADVRQVTGFVQTVLAAVAVEQAWYVLPRQGEWRFGGHGVPLRNQALDIVVRGTGVPETHVGAVRFGCDAMPAVVALVVASLVFGWGVGEDLSLVPDDGSCVLLTSHDAKILGHFPSTAALASAEHTLRQPGYPSTVVSR